MSAKFSSLDKSTHSKHVKCTKVNFFVAQVILSTVLQNNLCTVCMDMAKGETFMAIYGLPRFRAILIL